MMSNYVSGKRTIRLGMDPESPGNWTFSLCFQQQLLPAACIPSIFASTIRFGNQMASEVWGWIRGGNGTPGHLDLWPHDLIMKCIFCNCTANCEARFECRKAGRKRHNCKESYSNRTPNTTKTWWRSIWWPKPLRGRWNCLCYR